MSLLRLLTAGKSLVQSKEGNRYRVTSQRLLPKFEAKKNPFGMAVSPGEAEISVPEAQVESHAPAARGDTTPRDEAQRQGQGHEQDQDKDQDQDQDKERMRVGWVGELKSWIGRRFAKSRKPFSPRLGNGPVQTELSLERVRVVRNDLSDADLEVVQANKTKAPSAPVTRPEPGPEKAEAAPNRLARLGSRLFAAGKN